LTGLPTKGSRGIVEPIGTWLIELDAAADRDVDDARSDERVGEVGRLLRRAALRVDRRGAATSIGSPCASQALRVTFIDCIADLPDAAADDLADLCGIDAGSLEHADLSPRQELCGMEPGEPAIALAAGDGGAEGLDDHGFGHDDSPGRVGVRRGEQQPPVGAPRPRRAAGARGRAHAALPRIMALVGTPTPAVTSTWSLRRGWLQDVPRISRTPSFTPFMPCT
jgi:hypothetical protein